MYMIPPSVIPVVHSYTRVVVIGHDDDVMPGRGVVRVSVVITMHIIVPSMKTCF